MQEDESITVARRVHSKLIYNYLYFFLRHEDDASDALAETFRRALRGRKTFRGECSERAWLMKIASNVAKRSKQRRCRDGSLSLDAMNATAISEIVDTFNVEESVLNAYEAQRFLQMLPPRQREAVWMRVGLKMTDEEVAIVLAVPPGTVSSWVWRSMERLRRESQRK